MSGTGTDAQQAAPADLMVCAVGASAGGLTPVEEFFGALPPKPGFAFVLIQHLASDHESIMGVLLEQHTSMPVNQAVDGEELEANCVYLIPPGAEISMTDGRMEVRKRSQDRRGLHRPIDTFFTSMAADRGSRCAAVILSGSGSDGTEGIAAVRRAGGLTLAQDGSASFASMPEEATRSGFIDAVLPPGELALACIEFSRSGTRPDDSTGDPPGLPGSMAVLTDLISAEAGIAFTDYKPGTLRRRIERRLTLDGAGGLPALVDRAERDPGFARALAEELLIDVTGFFRDPAAFELIEGVAAQLVAEATASGNPIRVWVAGCATGEEAYSIGMVLTEGLDHIHGTVPDIQIFATDIHDNALATAAAGTYPDSALAGVSDTRRERFFHRAADGWRVSPELRSLVTFARHDLLTDSPFSRIDLVCCRNVLIYFLSSAQERVISSLAFALNGGGVMVLGSSEALGSAEVDFEPISTSWRIYRKKTAAVSRARANRLGLQSRHRTNVNPTPMNADRRLSRAYDRLLDAHFVAGFIVDERRQLVHTIGDATKWMRPPVGRPSNDIMTLIEDPTLRLAAGAILRELEAGEEQPTPRIVPDVAHENTQMTLHGSLVPGDSTATYLVYSRPAVEAAHAALIAPTSGEDTDGYVGQLEVELHRTRDSLQTALEEHETANEELSATNEELVASNEELQSTNEELSSVNEELHTLNDENRIRLDEVLEVTADLQQLMSSTDIGVVFLAEDGTIRRFNETARDYFRVRDTDIKRPFSDIATRLDYESLWDDIDSVAGGGPPVAMPVMTQEDPPRRSIVRIDRYDLPRGRSGVFIALVDVSDVHLSVQERLMATLLQASPISIVLWDKANRPLYRNRSMIAHEGGVAYDPQIAGLPSSREVSPKFLAAIKQVRRTGETVVGFDQLVPADDSEAVVGFEDFFYAVFPVSLDARELVGSIGLPATEVHQLIEIGGQAAVLEAVSRHDRVRLVTIGEDGGPIRAVDAADDPESERVTVELMNRITDHEDLRSALATAVAGNPARVDVTLGPNGRETGLIDLSVQPVLTDSAIRAVGIGVDVSDYRQRIESLEDDVERLRSELSSERRAGADRAGDLAERNEDLDNFAHIAAHDLKAPIRSVRAFAELAQEEVRKGGDGQELLDRVIEGADRMTSLVQSLLDFASIDRQRPLSEAVDIGHLLDESTADLGSEIERTGATVNLPEVHISVLGDRAALRQVFTNLIGNAVKYGGESPEVSVAVVGDDDRGGVTVTVADTGMGFDMAHVERLFEPFQRLHDTTISGNGVGLAICRRIVSRHGGSIWATSEPDKGSKFSVWLPNVPEADDA